MSWAEGWEGLKSWRSVKKQVGYSLQTACQPDTAHSYHDLQIFQEYLKSFLHWKHKDTLLKGCHLTDTQFNPFR